MKSFGLMLLCGAMVLGLGAGVAVAFPPFKAAFEERYVKTGSAAIQASFKEAGCNACHVKGAESKKEKNAYGVELEKLLRASGTDIKERIKSDKDGVLKELDDAFTKCESAKSANGKTYGECFKEGVLP